MFLILRDSFCRPSLPVRGLAAVLRASGGAQALIASAGLAGLGTAQFFPQVLPLLWRKPQHAGLKLLADMRADLLALRTADVLPGAAQDLRPLAEPINLFLIGF
jgi:hypothetical protein